MVKNILLVGSEKDNKGVLELFLEARDLKVDYVTSIEHARRWKQYNTINMAIFRIDELNPKVIDQILHFKNQTTQYCIILYKELSLDTIESVFKHKGLFLLSSETEDSEILGFCSRVLSGNITSQRKNERFPTDQKMQLAEYNSTEFLFAKLINLSKTGAGIQTIQSTIQYRRADVIKLKIQLNQVNKNHHLYGIIRWIKSNDDFTQTLGVEFISLEKVKILA